MPVSLRGRLIYATMRQLLPRVMPTTADIDAIRNASSMPALGTMPHGVTWAVGEAGGVPGDWIRPANAPADRALLYLHGGGYVLKTPAMHRVLVARLARAMNSRAFIADYRLAPEHPFPAALDDAIAAYRGLIASGIAPNRIVLAGDSAGGGLAAALMLHLRDAGEPGEPRGSLPAAAWLISALLDCTLTHDSITALQSRDPMLRASVLKPMVEWYAGEHGLDHPLISPVFADLHGLPPLLIHAGENEILRADSTRFAENARAAGVNVTLKVWQGMVHAFPVFATLIPEGMTAIDEASAFFRAHLA